jgi:thioredoxin reductase (NADPH)
MFGGALQHTDVVEDYSAFTDAIAGAQLAARMIEQAETAGVTLEQAEVSGVELFSRSRWVACSDGRGFSCGVVILAGGTHYKRTGLSNEDRFRGRGVVDCTPCDAGFFVDRDVVVYGSSDYALRDALYLAGQGTRVTLLAPEGALDGKRTLQARVRATPGILVRVGLHLEEIIGSDRVEGVVCTAIESGARERIAAQGLLVRLGMEPDSQWLDDAVDLDDAGYIIAGSDCGTSAAYVLACGDIRSGSRSSVETAVGEGVGAAAQALDLLASVNH